MMRRAGNLVAVLALAGLVVLAGCAKRQTVKQEEGPVPGTAAAGLAPGTPGAPGVGAPGGVAGAPGAVAGVPGPRVGEGTLGEREAR
ncbi:MAG: hypothetical protein HYY85_19270, partial [Deltaproteobacteria bacterium]|nr:hypothetical protein [Deltaproteobacteria bacterium]